MEKLIKTGRAFYGFGIAGIGVQQFIYGGFRPVLLPELPSWVPWQFAWAYAVGALLIFAGALIIFSANARKTATMLGLAFLFLFLFFQVTYQLFFSPYSFNIGLWTDPLKELAFCGGAFLIANSYEKNKAVTRKTTYQIFLEALLSFGNIFFAITMIVFGIDHFIYTKFVATLVPAWMPGHIFWTYFAGTALIGSGVCIALNFRLKLIGMLLGIMLFIWFVILHIPRAIADPYVDKGNEVTSVFEALAFSGIAFVIACMPWGKARRFRVG